MMHLKNICEMAAILSRAQGAKDPTVDNCPSVLSQTSPVLQISMLTYDRPCKLARKEPSSFVTKT